MIGLKYLTLESNEKPLHFVVIIFNGALMVNRVAWIDSILLLHIFQIASYGLCLQIRFYFGILLFGMSSIKNLLLSGDVKLKRSVLRLPFRLLNCSLQIFWKKVGVSDLWITLFLQCAHFFHKIHRKCLGSDL